MRIGALFHPTMLFAFADGAGLKQNQTWPILESSGTRVAAPSSSTSNSLLHRCWTNPSGPSAVPAANTKLGFGIVGAGAFPPVPPPCADETDGVDELDVVQVIVEECPNATARLPRRLVTTWRRGRAYGPGGASTGELSGSRAGQ
jgi:hypothetical protein